MAEIKWIKIATEVFDNRKIRQIEIMPEGDSILVIWFKLLCLAGNVNDKGMIYFTNEIPYTDQMLAAQFNRSLTTVQMALNLFQRFGMIDIIDDIIHVSSWEKYQNVEGMEKIREQTRKRVAAHREKQKLLGCNVTSNATVTHGNETDKDKELDIEEDKDKKKNKKKKPANADFTSLISSYTSNVNLVEVLNAFVEMRISIKAKPTERAMKMLLNKLDKMTQSDDEKILILENSIMNNWKDVYELKNQQRGNLNAQSFRNTGQGIQKDSMGFEMV